MENLQQQNQFKEIESEFYLSKSALVVLFFISIAGLLIGLSGWITSPGILWQIPESYYIFITFATIILLGLTFTVRILMQSLSLAITELKGGK